MYKIKKNGVLAGCPVIIYDEDNNILSKTIIEAHDESDKHISILDTHDGIDAGTRLVLLVLLEGCQPREFSGVARVAYNKMREVSIYNERPGERRSATRHKLNSPAAIRHLIVDSVKKPICPILGVIVANISTSGMFLKSPPGFFSVGSTVEVDINIKGKDVLLYGNVVWVRQIDDNSFGYGCKLVFS